MTREQRAARGTRVVRTKGASLEQDEKQDCFHGDKVAIERTRIRGFDGKEQALLELGKGDDGRLVR